MSASAGADLCLGIVQDEQEEQTMTYLLIRPIPKWALYSVKLLATLTTTVILAVGSDGSDLRGRLCGRQDGT